MYFITFIEEWWLVLSIVIAAGICGSGFIAPFAEVSPRLVFAAPIVGITVVPLGTNAFYTLLGLSYVSATLLSVVVCTSLTAVMLLSIRPTLGRKDYLLGAGVLLVVSALFVLVVDTATITTGRHAILFMEGSDQSGYAQVADWLHDHPHQVWPSEASGAPYQSWPSIMFTFDPRFGSFGFLAMISWLHQSSALFSFDFACTVILTASLLSLGLFYSSSPGILALLTTGLFASSWLDYAHGGYFGKILGYPSALLIAGLIIQTLRSPSIIKTACLVILLSAAAIAHAGVATSVLIAPIVVTALISNTLFNFERENYLNSLAIVSLTIIVPVISTGLLARPALLGFPDYKLEWSYILPRVLDLENQGAIVTSLSANSLWALATSAFLAWVTIILLAIASRNVLATSFTLGPAALLLGLYVVGAGGMVFQMIGYFFPAVLCGAAVLCGNARVSKAIVVGLLAATVALRIPRLAGAINRYAIAPSRGYIFTETEIANLARTIGSQPVSVEVKDLVPDLVLLVELGRRELDVRWSRDDWEGYILRYRGGDRNWVWPGTEPGKIKIIQSKERNPGHQFDLVPSNP